MGVGERTVVLAAEGKPAGSLVEWYISNFHRQGDRLVVVHAEESEHEDKWIMLASGRAAMSAGDRKCKHNSVFRPTKCSKIQKHCLAILDQHKVKGEFVCREGSLGEVIVDIAKEEDASLVVMTDHHHSRLWRALVGSSLDYVARHTSVPLLTYSLVKPKNSTKMST